MKGGFFNQTTTAYQLFAVYKSFFAVQAMQKTLLYTATAESLCPAK